VVRVEGSSLTAKSVRNSIVTYSMELTHCHGALGMKERLLMLNLLQRKIMTGARLYKNINTNTICILFGIRELYVYLCLMLK